MGLRSHRWTLVAALLLVSFLTGCPSMSGGGVQDMTCHIACDLIAIVSPSISVRNAQTGELLCGATVVATFSSKGRMVTLEDRGCFQSVPYQQLNDIDFYSPYQLDVARPDFKPATVTPPPLRKIPCSCDWENDVVRVALEPI